MLFNSFPHLLLGLPSDLFCSGFPPKSLRICLLPIPATRQAHLIHFYFYYYYYYYYLAGCTVFPHITAPIWQLHYIHPFLLDRPENIWWAVQIRKFLFTHFSPVPSCFTSLSLKRLTARCFVKRPHHMFFP